eukprot:UN3247
MAWGTPNPKKKHAARARQAASQAKRNGGEAIGKARLHLTRKSRNGAPLWNMKSHPCKPWHPKICSTATLLVNPSSSAHRAKSNCTPAPA